MARVAAAMRQDRAQLGIAMMLCAYLMFSLIDTSVKWFALAGFHAFQLAFMRYVGHFAVSFAQIARGGLTLDRLGSARIGLTVLRAAAILGSTLANFFALRYLPLSVTASILFSAPMIVSALSVPLLGERVGPWRWGAIVLGFAGVLIVMRPFGEAFHPAMVLSLLGALSFALYSILTRMLSGEVAAETMQLYTGGLGTFAMLPFAIWTWQSPATAPGWLLLVLLGIWAWIGHELLTRAHFFAPASTLMPFTYSFLIYLTIGGYLVFDTLPDGITIVGAAVIVAAGLVIWWRERVQARPPLPPKPGF